LVLLLLALFTYVMLFLRFAGRLPFQTDPRLAEARDTAKLFLDAVRNEDGSSAYGLLPKDYRDRLPAEERDTKKMNVAVVGGKRLSGWTLGAGKLSKDDRRATFDGSAQARDGRERSFQLVVVEEVASWRVELFTVQQ
jgi:hypothetical protein